MYVQSRNRLRTNVITLTKAAINVTALKKASFKKPICNYLLVTLVISMDFTVHFPRRQLVSFNPTGQIILHPVMCKIDP